MTPQLPLTPERAPDKARIARIITADQIVLNVGRVNGVTVGSRWNVIHKVEVRDPENLERVLAMLDYVKATLEVTQVFDAVSIAKPPAREVDFGVQYHFATTLLPSSLNVDPTQVALSDDDLKIHEGDVAVRDKSK
jgi:hypothetical protein